VARIAVIGATGFVGTSAVRLLVREGYEVSGLSRSGDALAGTSLVAGDVCDAGTAGALIAGCEYVVHLAPGFSSEPDTTTCVTEGTRIVLDVCREAGVRRLVYLSCLGADASAESPYYRAKWEAETAVRNSDLPWVILRPSMVVGRGDGITQPLADLIRSSPLIPVPGRGRVRCQPIDVEDLARCILISLTDDTLNQQMISVGGPTFLTFRHLVDLVAGQLGAHRPKVLIPLRLVPSIASLLPAGRSLFLPPRLTQFQQGVVASPGIVKRMFAFEPRSIVPLLGTYFT